VKWYNGFAQNLVTIIQIHQGLCMFNYVQCGAGLHLSEKNVLVWSLFGDTHCTSDCVHWVERRGKQNNTTVWNFKGHTRTYMVMYQIPGL